jgi:hypothetical protein
MKTATFHPLCFHQLLMILLVLGFRANVLGQNARIAAGYEHSQVLCLDSTLMSWGDNTYGAAWDC